MIQSSKLQNGHNVAMGVIEVVSIPHISILESKYNDKSKEEVFYNYKEDMKSLLSELHQVYKLTGAPISYELLWMTSPETNQTYSAKISLYVVVRCLNPDENKAINEVERAIKLINEALVNSKYDVQRKQVSDFIEEFKNIDDSSVKFIRKKEDAVNLQNQMIPFCYVPERINTTALNLDKISNVLTEHPNCAISLQLTPFVLSQDESRAAEAMMQMLTSLAQGVMEMGNISITAAEEPAENYRYYVNNKNSAMFQYAIAVYGNENSCISVSSKLFGHLVGVGDKQSKLVQYDVDSRLINKNGNYFPLPWAINEIIAKQGRNVNIWNTKAFAPLARMPFWVTAEEAAEFFRLPVGDENVYAGLNVNESQKNTKKYAANIINAGDITVGKLKSSSKGDTIGISLKDLTKHMLVVGSPGSGKTTFSVSLLDRLWKEHNIPFLVIEPAKNEYRALVQSIPELQVFTPGKNFISPFVFNPFVPPKNVKLETYKSTLKTAFSAAVSMSTPLDKIFEETVNNCYSDFRWLDTYTTDNKGQIFNISDFIKCFENTFENIGYTGDAKNIGRAGVVRLSGLVNLFDNYFSIPIEDILKKPTVIELAAIENSDEKALIIALILLSVLSYVNVNYTGDGKLKNVILLEEAHVLLDADTNAGLGEANPSAIAQRLVKRMLAEIRSYGVGMVIADQSPRKVTTDVVALTDMKVVFRLVESEDKQIIGDSTNMEDSKVTRLGKLKPGEAFLFYNRLSEAEEVITPDYRLENNISITLSDDGIKELSTYWLDKKDKLRPYPQCLYAPCCKESCDYNRRILGREVARRIFVKYIKQNCENPEIVKKVFKNLTKLIKAELNDEEFTSELRTCVKVHLWRKVIYNTKIKVSSSTIENTVKQ